MPHNQLFHIIIDHVYSARPLAQPIILHFVVYPELCFNFISEASFWLPNYSSRGRYFASQHSEWYDDVSGGDLQASSWSWWASSKGLICNVFVFCIPNLYRNLISSRSCDRWLLLLLLDLSRMQFTMLMSRVLMSIIRIVSLR